MKGECTDTSKSPAHSTGTEHLLGDITNGVPTFSHPDYPPIVSLHANELGRIAPAHKIADVRQTAEIAKSGNECGHLPSIKVG
ncbi:hypothetical protein ABIB56_001986 [Glaciihabitans sp. UYNi722]